MKPRIFLPVVAALSLTLCAGCSSGDTSAQQGQRAQLEARQATHVIVTISANDRVRVDGERFSPKELPDVLKNKGRIRPGRPVLLLVQKDTKPDAIAFVRKNAGAANLGAVEVMVAE